MESDELGDRMVEVYFTDQDMMLRIYPAANYDPDDDGAALQRVLAQPASVSAELRSLPDNGQIRIVYYGSPEVLIIIGEAILTGVAGNAAYDALKVAVFRCNAKLRKLGDGGRQRLSEDDAVRLARTLLRAWHETDGRIKKMESKLNDSNKWVIVLKANDTLWTITIPPGPLIRAKIRITSRDGRSAVRLLCQRVTWTVWDLRYRLFRRQ